MITIKSFDVSIELYHVGCKAGSKGAESHVSMVYSRTTHGGRVFICSGCKEEFAVRTKLIERT